MLHRIRHVPSYALLEILDRGIIEKRSSIQLHAWGPDKGCSPVVNPFFPLSSSPRLRLLGPPLGLDLLRRLFFPDLHHFLPFLLPFPFVVGRISLDWLGGWRSGEPGLRSLPWSISPPLRLQQLLEGGPLFALDTHITGGIRSFLISVGWG